MSSQPESKRSRPSSDDGEPEGINDLSPHWVASPKVASRRILADLPHRTRKEYSHKDRDRSGNAVYYLARQFYVNESPTSTRISVPSPVRINAMYMAYHRCVWMMENLKMDDVWEYDYPPDPE